MSEGVVPVPTVAWILLWGLAIAVVSVLVVREVRAGRHRRVVEVDRFRHAAARDAERQRDLDGPNGAPQTWTG